MRCKVTNIRLFEQEAKRLDDLGKHPQIPELLSFTIHEGKQYLIQEFIDGETLEQELRRVGAFSEQQVQDKKNIPTETLIYYS